MDLSLAEFFFNALIAIVFIINPISKVGVLLSLTDEMDPKQRNDIALRSNLVACAVLIFFAISGYFIFQIYSITIDTFRIAGGMILAVIGMRMLFPPVGEREHKPVGEIYLVPLAIPLTSGPGSITMVVMLATQVHGMWESLTLWLSIIAACAINYWVIRSSDWFNRKLGHEGIVALTKIMGLLICSLAVQFIITGLKAAFPVLAG